MTNSPSRNQPKHLCASKSLDQHTRWGITGKRLLVAKLKADASFSTEAERVRAFIAQQGGCRATYYNHARRLGRPLELPKLQLNHLPPDWTPSCEVSLLDLLRRRFGTLGRDQPL